MRKNSWTLGTAFTALQQNAVDSTTDGERVFAPAYRPNEDILSSDNIGGGGALGARARRAEKKFGGKIYGRKL